MGFLKDFISSGMSSQSRKYADIEKKANRQGNTEVAQKAERFKNAAQDLSDVIDSIGSNNDE